MFKLETVTQLYDACTKIGAGMAASRAAIRQRERSSRSSERSPRAESNASSTDRSKSPSIERTRRPSPMYKINKSTVNNNTKTEIKDKAECYRYGRNNH